MSNKFKLLQKRYSSLLKKEIDSKRTVDKINEVICEREIDDCSMFARSSTKAKNIQELFNRFFRDDLYGKYKDDNNIILSSGSLASDEYPLGSALRYTIDFALEKNWYGYSHSLGHLNAREAVVDLLRFRLKKYKISIENVALIGGVTSGINIVLKSLNFIKGRSINILTHLPTYSPFFTACDSLANLDYVFLKNAKFDANTFISALKDDTDAILILGDLNPLGEMVSVKELNILINECNKRDIWIIFDEAGAVYPEYDFSDLIYSKKLILLNSDSKSLGVPGLKTGYLCGDAFFIDHLYSIASYSYGSPASIFYLFQEFNARLHLFMLMNIDKVNSSHLKLFREDYEIDSDFLQLLYDNYKSTYEYNFCKIKEKRKWIVDELNRQPRHLISQLIVPSTGVNLSLQIAQWDSSYDFFLSLLHEKQVAVYPGCCSGIDSGCWIRISYAIEDESLHEGVKRLVDFLHEHDVYSICKKEPIYNRALIEYGLFSNYPWLNFYRHIDKVYRIMLSILDKSQIEINEDNKNYCRDLAYLHDLGKVISVRLAAAHRVMKMQRKENPCWSDFSDIDLLGLKNNLINGDRYSWDELKRFIPDEIQYAYLINWDAYYSPTDDVVRNILLDQIKINKKIKKTLNRHITLLNASSLMDDIILAVLDIADKCCDGVLEFEISKENLLLALDRKRQYVMNRYRPSFELIEEEFKITKTNIEYLL